MNKNLTAYIVLVITALLLYSCKTMEKSPVAKGKDNTSYFAFKSELLDGVRNKMTGNYDAALDNFSRASRWDPKQAVSYYEMATVLAIKNDYPAALEYCKLATGLSKNNYYYTLLLASLYQANAMSKEAAETYDEVIRLKPSIPDNYFSQSSIYLSVSDPKKALQSLDKAEEYFGVTHEINSEKYDIAVTSRNYPVALKEINKLIEAYPKESIYYAMLAELYKVMGKTANVAEVYQMLEGMDVRNGMVLVSLAEYYSSQGNNEKAFAILEKAFALDDFDMDSKIQILFNLIVPTENDVMLTEKVYRLLEILVLKYPDEPKVHTIYGDYLVRDRRWEEAQSRFNFVLKNEKSHYEIWEQALLIDNQIKDWTSMYDRSNEALQYFPMQVTLYVFNTEAAMQLSKYSEAVMAAESGLRFAAGNDDIKLDFYIYLGEAYHKTNQHELSDSAFENSLKLDSQNTFVLNNYSYYLSLRNERVDKALQLSENLMLLESENANFIDTHAWALFRNQKYNDALIYIEKAVIIDGEKNPNILEHYGDILSKTGKTEKAVQCWKKAKEMGSGSKTIDLKIEKQQYTE